MVQLRPGDTVCHLRFGFGVVQWSDPAAARAEIKFAKHGAKLLSLDGYYNFYIRKVNGQSIHIHSKYQHSLLYLVHIRNLRSIFRYGILSRMRVMQLVANFEDISYGSVQRLRSRISIKHGDDSRPLHSYVNLFFAAKPPMLAVFHNRARQDDLVYLEISPTVLDLPGTLIADGNAAIQGLSQAGRETVTVVVATSAAASCQRWYDPPSFLPHRRVCSNFYVSSVGLDCVDFGAVATDDRWLDEETKRRKQAEVLVPDEVPVYPFVGVAVRSRVTRQRVEALLAEAGIECLDVVERPEWYFDW